ncbi:MAG: DsbA family protein [Patescibacteria group bacterium]|nr:DsbA family protein [Patescibacteria group bacterium]MDE2172537.1 DsbA family protein [Patescibacteria group bacterium]
MNSKRIIFWAGFVIILGLIVWGLIAAFNKPGPGAELTAPPPVTAADHVIGNQNAPVTIIEYGDFQCPACGYYYPTVERLIAESSSTMRLVFRHFPLSQHQNAMAAAMTSEAAAVQGKFWEMYSLLYQNQDAWSNLNDPSSIFAGYAAQLGLNMTEYTSDIGSSTLRDVITSDQDGGIAIGIDQTPTFFVNGKVITNPPSYDQFKALIDAAASSSSQ